MKELEEKIRSEGVVKAGNVLKVDGFINHRIDVPFMCKCGQEFYRLYKDCGVNKILTVEASGIGIACITAQYFGVPVVFAKKSRSSNIADDVYTESVASFTHGTVNNIIVSKEYLSKDDNVLIIDDFLAKGNALIGLTGLVKQAGGRVVGCGILVEKSFQEGRGIIEEMGIRVESLARVASMDPEKGIEFVR